ncbi:uncharacterized protein LOC131436163 [Malaya genurostris]|uniref:uncharacterized protein LOC131436163 n=1 Tax=Malaya genurostris TaxID=325434 RepID=UPI0026F3AB0C|nr:uncharacterized protein LOC131436163 [Malaya genurostris]
MADNITVSIKVRPLIKREKDLKLSSQWRIRQNTIAHIDGNGEPFVFDHIFDETIRTRALFECVCRPIIRSALSGINGTIFAYGQTSSGKTYTMMGNEEEPGVVPLTAQEIFKEIENSKDRQFLIRVGYIEIYNEKIFDLLDKSNANLKIFETACGDVTLNYKEVITNCPEQIMQHLEEGNKIKRIGDTNMNERSSRSHTIFRITIESSDVGRTEGDENDAVQISTLNLVDLAGSERADQTGATGSRLKEGAHINKSLLSLSCVIQKLSENADNLKYINYRDSKLTRILQASLGGNAATSMICNITPAALDESYYTLSFAMRAKTIKNKPIVNEVISEAAMMKRLQREIKRLQDELKSEQSKNSKIKTLELQNAITMRANQIINSQTHIYFDKSRRRTWCPSSSGIPRPVDYTEHRTSGDSRLMPPPPPFLSSATATTTTSSRDEKSPVVRPELAQRGRSDLLVRNVRSTTPVRHFMAVDTLDNSDEFIPAELVDFGERSPQSLAREIHTPCGFKTKRRSRRSSAGDSPASYVNYEERCRELQQELLELQEFTNLEKNLDLANIKCREKGLDSLEERCRDLDEELRQKREQIFDMEKELIVARKERDVAVKDAEHCRNLQNSVQVEYELFQQRAKNREKELIECLQEARVSTTGDKVGQADSVKKLEQTRKELKQLEVHNYELQLQLETCSIELEKLKNFTQEQTEKVGKVRNVLDKDISRKDAQKLFRIITKLRGILAEEDLLINTSINTDELVDSIGDDSFSESLDRQSPTKIVLTNDSGKANVIYDNDNCQMLDMNIENGELKMKIKSLEKENKEMNILLLKYENELKDLNEKEVQLKEVSEQLKQERSRFNNSTRSLQDKKLELDKMTLEYNELSTQVMDFVQEIDGYKDQIDRISKNSKILEETVKVLQLEKEQLAKEMRETENEMIDLRSKHEEEVKELLACKLENENQIKKLEDDLQIRNEESEKETNDRLSSVQKELDEKMKIIEEFTKSKELLLQQDNKYQEDMLSIRNDLEQKISLVGELEQENQRLIQQMNDIKQEKINVENKYEEKEKETLSVISEQESKITNLRKEAEKLLEQISALQKTVSDKENNLQLVSSKLASSNEQNSNLLEQLSQMQREKKWLPETENSEYLSHHGTDLQASLAEIASLRAENISLAHQLNDLQQNHRAVLADKNKVDEKCENLCNELSRLITEKEQINENDRLTLKNEINLLQQAKLKLEEETSGLKNHISSLEAQLVDVDEQKTKLSAKLQSLENEMEESSNIRELLEREVQALKTDLCNLEQQLNENNEKVEHFQKQNNQYQQELSHKSEEIERACQTQKDLRNSMIQLEQKLSQIDATSQNESEWMEKLQQAESCRQEQTSALEKLTNEKASLLEKIEEASTERDFLKQKLLEKDAFLEQAYQQITSLESQATDLSAKLGQAESSLIEVKQLKEDLNALEKAKNAAQEQAQQESTAKSSLMQQMVSKDEQIEEATRRVASLENQVSDLKLEMEQMELNQLETTHTKEHLEQEVSVLKSLLDAKQKDCSESVITIANQKENISELEYTVKNLSQQLTEKESEFVSKYTNESTQLEALRKQISNLIAQLETEKHAHQTDLSREKNSSSKLQLYIEEIEQVKLTLQGEKGILEENYKDLQNTHTNLVEKFQLLEQSNIQLDAQLVNLNAELIIREEKLKSITRELASKLTDLDKLKLDHYHKTEEINEALTKSTQLNYDMGQQIKSLEQEKLLLQDQLKREQSKVISLTESEVPSLRSTIEQLENRQQELSAKLSAQTEDLSNQTLELKRLTELYNQEKTNSSQLAQQLEEAKLMPALQPDGRPSLGDGKVAQALRKENDDLLKQLNELQKTHQFKTNQFQERIDELKEELSTMRHNSSFQEKETQIVALEGKINHYEQVYEETKNKHRSLQRQNDELRVKHQNLVMEMDDLRRLADRDRRSRRQSTHDDRRGMCFNTRDGTTMTDPTSTDCSCLEMDALIKDLRKQLTIKECQLNTTKMMASVNPLKNDVIELRRLVKDRESDIFKLQDEIRTLSVALDREQKQIDKQCSTCVRTQRMRSLRSDKAVNTDLCESTHTTPSNHAKQLEETQEELRKLNSKYQDMKRLCRIRNEKIVSLSQDIAEKENGSGAANRNFQQEVSLLKHQLKESEDKYSQVLNTYQNKQCANKVEKTVQTDAAKNDEVEMLRSKYEKYKNMAISLLEQNEELKRKTKFK